MDILTRLTGTLRQTTRVGGDAIRTWSVGPGRAGSVKLRDRSASRRRQAAIALSAAFVVGAGALATPAYAQPDSSKGVTAQVQDACPAPVAAADIVPGMIGTGWTVVTGQTPKPFEVKVLGVLKDGIGAGRDMVVFEATDLDGETFIEKNGIWAGMSGSPVYVDGKLLGAVSYGFSASPLSIGGLTPATDMLSVLDSPAAGQAKAKATAKTKVSVSASQRKALNAQATAAVPSTLQQLRTPVSVSGLSSKRLASLQKAFDGAGRSVVVYPGGAASKTVKANTVAPEPGGNFGAVSVYGDFTVGGVGTTTAVCGNKVLAFGHPMDFAGAVTYGATAADSLAIIKDTTFGSYKLANLGDTFGTVDQDRKAAIRATLGAGPVTTPITSTITNLDNGKTRTGTTQVAQPDYTSAAAVYGLWSNYDSTFDKWGKGLTTATWTLQGTRAGGNAFSLSRTNMWSDLGDATYDPPFELAGAVDSLLSNEYEPVKITSINVKSSVTSAYDRYRITKLAVSVNGGKYKNVSAITVKPKAKLKVRVTMRGYKSSVDRNVVLNLKVAKRYAKQTGTITVQGGLSAASSLYGDPDLSCLLMDCDESDGSLDSIMSDITSPPRNNVVRADLDFGENEEDEFTGDARTFAAAPVTGEKVIVIKVKKK